MVELCPSQCFEYVFGPLQQQRSFVFVAFFEYCNENMCWKVLKLCLLSIKTIQKRWGDFISRISSLFLLECTLINHSFVGACHKSEFNVAFIWLFVLWQRMIRFDPIPSLFLCNSAMYIVHWLQFGQLDFFFFFFCSIMILGFPSIKPICVDERFYRTKKFRVKFVGKGQNDKSQGNPNGIGDKNSYDTFQVPSHSMIYAWQFKIKESAFYLCALWFCENEQTTAYFAVKKTKLVDDSRISHPAVTEKVAFSACLICFIEANRLILPFLYPKIMTNSKIQDERK